jgi:protein gp37
MQGNGSGLMGDNTGIEWTDATWNPIVGCSIVSPGCTNCYAMRWAYARLDRPHNQFPHYRGTTQGSKAGGVWTGKLALAPDHIIQAPLKWKKPRRVFVNSMGDLFHEDCPDEWIDHVFIVMASTPQHTFQVLTKRAERMRRYITELREKRSIIPDAFPWPLPNVWLGVSAEDQRRADERIPLLLDTPAAVRFISAEPLLGPIDVTHIDSGRPFHVNALVGYFDHTNGRDHQTRLDWVIAGGESGPNARPMHPDWARGLRDQCAAAGVPFFFKQWGELAPNGSGRYSMIKVGKKAAGRLLDGREHNDMPEVRR